MLNGIQLTVEFGKLLSIQTIFQLKCRKALKVFFYDKMLNGIQLTAKFHLNLLSIKM